MRAANTFLKWFFISMAIVIAWPGVIGYLGFAYFCDHDQADEFEFVYAAAAIVSLLAGCIANMLYLVAFMEAIT